MVTTGSRSEAVSRRRIPAGFDVGLLTALIVLLVGVPSILILGPLGGAGTPAEVLGLGMLIIWLFRRISSRQTVKTRNLVRIALAVFLVSVVSSYLAAVTRAIDGLELNAADRGVLSALAWLGMALFMMDSPSSRNQLDTVLRR